MKQKPRLSSNVQIITFLFFTLQTIDLMTIISLYPQDMRITSNSLVTMAQTLLKKQTVLLVYALYMCVFCAHNCIIRYKRYDTHIVVRLTH